MHGLHRQLYGEAAHAVGDFRSLTFNKSGSEIQRAIDSRLEQLESENRSERNTVAKICKDRQIDVDEVLNADTEEKVGAYSQKVLDTAPRAALALQALERDLSTIRQATNRIWANNHASRQLALIKKNIEANRGFDLTFGELASLGF